MLRRFDSNVIACVKTSANTCIWSNAVVVAKEDVLSLDGQLDSTLVEVKCDQAHRDIKDITVYI